MKKTLFILSLVLPSLLLGIAIGIISPIGDNTYLSKEVRSGKFEFINPLLECDSTDTKSFVDTQESLQKLINIKSREGKISDVSIYFRDLNRGIWFGINDNSKFIPASLLKVPVMMTYYKAAEANPDVLKIILEYDGKLNLNEIQENFVDKNNLRPNEKYSIDELINRMIIYSDNNALDLIQRYLINNKNLDNSFQELLKTVGISLSLNANDEFISVKEYSYFFRLLYNASYLNPDFSNKALKTLSKVVFKDGLIDSVPKDIVISHKYGERAVEYFEQNNTNGSEIIQKTELLQLHDCGIIYYQPRPYLLCVMTKGDDYEQLKQVIKEISELVFLDIKK